MKEVFQHSRMRLMALLLFLFVGTLPLAGCGGGGGSDSYDEPDTTTNNRPVVGQTENVLIDAATLKTWVDAGLVNNETGYEKVVILDAASSNANYLSGHIPGAQFWNTGAQVMNRVEGPVETVNLVLDGAAMDTLLQQHGIDERTTVVITSPPGTAVYLPSRAYFLLRYWGFPKEKLKILNGFNGAWTAAGYALEAAVPAIQESAYSVRDLPQFRPDLRASLSEMITALDEDSVTVVDFRSDAMPAATAGVFADDHGADVVVFEGTMKNGKYFAFSRLTNSDGTFKDAAALGAELAAAGIDNSKKIVTMCRTAYIASAGFVAIDAIMGWDAMVYDGSWSQWGSLSTIATGKGGQLPNDSLWYTDDFDLMDVIIYNQDAGKLIEPTRYDALSPAAYLSPFDDGANNIEDEDYAYWATPAAGSAPTAGGVAGGGGGC